MYLESILPVTNETHFCENNKIILANRIIYHIAKERGLEYIDLHQRYFYNGSLPPAWSYDGIHLVKEYYLEWYKGVSKYVYE